MAMDFNAPHLVENLDGYHLRVCVQDNKVYFELMKTTPGLETQDGVTVIEPSQVLGGLAGMLRDRLAEKPFSIDRRYMIVANLEMEAYARDGGGQLSIQEEAGMLKDQDILSQLREVLDKLRAYKTGNPRAQLAEKLAHLGKLPPGRNLPLNPEEVGAGDHFSGDDNEAGAYFHSEDWGLGQNEEDSTINNQSWLQKIGAEDTLAQAKDFMKDIDALLPRGLSDFGMLEAGYSSGVRAMLISDIERAVYNKLMRSSSSCMKLREELVNDIAHLLGEHLNLRIDDAQQERFFSAMQNAGAFSHTPRLAREDDTPGDIVDEYDLRLAKSIRAEENLARDIADSLVPDEYKIAEITGRDIDPPQNWHRK